MKKIIETLFLLIMGLNIHAQNVGIGTTTPHPSAQLDVSSNNKGFLPPRMTFAERNAINNPAQGLIIYCTDCDTSGQAQLYNGRKWTNLLGGLALNPIVTSVNLPYVTIGSQIWSTKNLDVAHYRNGDIIPQVTDPSQWRYLTTGAWCWYNNDSATYAASYGRLYNWYAVNDSRGLAPEGWHVPTNSEWDIMTIFLDSTVDTTVFQALTGTDVGLKMKSTNGWQGIGNGINTSGFNGFPAGLREIGGTFINVGTFAYWWNINASNSSSAWFRSLKENDSSIERSVARKYFGFSVRVIKD